MSDAKPSKTPLIFAEIGLRTIFRVILAGLLLYAAYNKISDPVAAEKFRQSIDAYKMLPDHLVRVSVFAFPWLEIVAGVVLVIGLWTRAAALLSIALFGAFIYAIGSAMNNPEVSLGTCGCFGDRSLFCEGAPSWCHITQNIGFILIGAWVLVRGGGPASIDALCRTATRSKNADA